MTGWRARMARMTVFGSSAGDGGFVSGHVEADVPGARTSTCPSKTSARFIPGSATKSGASCTGLQEKKRPSWPAGGPFE